MSNRWREVSVVILAATLVACGGGGTSAVPTIAVVNDAAATAKWDPGALPDAIAVWNAQLHNDMAPHWGVHVNVVLGRSGTYTLTFKPGLGESFHDDTGNAFVFIGSMPSTGEALLNAQHENLEMAEDPDAGSRPEIVDPVVCLTYNQGEPVKALECGENGEGSDRCVPDFVFPSYFQPRSAGPWDWMNQVKAAGVSPCA